MAFTQAIPRPSPKRHMGPPLAVLGSVSVALFVVGIVAAFAMTGGARYPIPYEPASVAQAYYSAHPEATRVSAFFLFASAVPLGLFAATAASQLRFLGARVAGTVIAQFGGFGAAFLLFVSGIAVWTLSQPGITDDVAVVRALQLLAFASGGFGHVVLLGLLLAGVSVPALLMKLVPRWIPWLGLVVAAICELSTLSMVAPTLSILIPIGRFVGFVWIIAMGIALPSTREGASNDA